MLQKIQGVFNNNFLAPRFIILFGLLKYVLLGYYKNIYMAWQRIQKMFSRKKLHLNTDNEK